MTRPEAATVAVVLNAQQIELLELLCAEHGHISPAAALRHALREYLRAPSPESGA